MMGERRRCGDSAVRNRQERVAGGSFLTSVTLAESMIRGEIESHGPISFARFMEIALYGPECGYYEKPGRRIGKGGDFYTNISVGPVFGFLLAAWFAESPRDTALDLVEAGAHDGQLAADILTALEELHPELVERVCYTIMEPSSVRRQAQQQRVGGRAWQVRWSASWEEMSPVRGFVFANELLDAFPVHRFGWDRAAGKWFEWGVTVAEDHLSWCRLDAGDFSIIPDTRFISDVLPDGFVLEASPARIAWWRDAARHLVSGALLTVDYGNAEPFGIRPERWQGSLRGYESHRVTTDLLSHPGERDLTADVDFDSIRRAGEEAGLETVYSGTQARWLGELASRILSGQRATARWLHQHSRQLHTLLDPNQLGQLMRVLVQRRAQG